MDSIETKTPYSEAYPEAYSQPSYASAHRNRNRGRSRGRQPYPQISSRAQRDGVSRRSKFHWQKQRPELRLNVDLPAVLPLNVNSSDANGSTTARTNSRSRSRGQSVLAVRERAQEEPVSSCPFAYSVSRSESIARSPDMDVDAMHGSDLDVQMMSPSCFQSEYSEAYPARRASPFRYSNSLHTRFSGFSLSPSPVALSPVEATEDYRENLFNISPTRCTLFALSV